MSVVLGLDATFLDRFKGAGAGWLPQLLEPKLSFLEQEEHSQLIVYQGPVTVG